ncbi:MAG TPA: site-2 protease family protein, partial [Flavisolibacter sp.]|nr:site-2 protease family protein [Flavisolibacter sp.]
MSLLLINWSAVLLQVGQLLLALSILVILHEFGHYITAKWFGCRVEKFYLFFDPWFSIVKKKIGETVYGIGWLPLGGYVKIAGMIDESMDKEQLKQPGQPWEFRSKPAWQRLIIMLGGVVMNILLAFIIYAFILMIWGDKKIPTASMKYGIH